MKEQLKQNQTRNQDSRKQDKPNRQHNGHSQDETDKVRKERQMNSDDDTHAEFTEDTADRAEAPRTWRTDKPKMGPIAAQQTTNDLRRTAEGA